MKKKRILCVAVVLLLLLQFTGCGSMTANDEAYDSYETSTSLSDKVSYGSSFNGASPEIDYEYTAEGTETVYKDDTSGTSVSTGENDLSARKIIKNASLSFETLTYDQFVKELENCIAAMGGYIQSSEGYGVGIKTSRQRYTYITARIPESNYNRFMTEICDMGTLTHKSETASDVTMSYVDTQSRIKSLQTEYDALITILEKATSLDDVIQLQSRISEVTYQLESYQSQLRKYDDLISYCTVHIDVNEVKQVTVNEEVMTLGERIEAGLSNTFEDIAISLEDFTVWFVTSLPYILIWAILVLVVILICRSAWRSSKKKKQKVNSNETKDESKD